MGQALVWDSRHAPPFGLHPRPWLRTTFFLAHPAQACWLFAGFAASAPLSPLPINRNESLTLTGARVPSLISPSLHLAHPAQLSHSRSPLLIKLAVCTKHTRYYVITVSKV